MVNLAVFAGVALAMWLAWASLILHIGGTLFPERRTRVDYGQLVRTTGFAAAPGVIQVFGVIPEITTTVFVIAWLWMLAAMVIAVRQALDYRTTWHAISVCVIALGVIVATTVVLGLALGRLVS